MQNIYIGVITEIDNSNVKVKYANTISDFVPYMQVANSFVEHLIPPKLDEVVILFVLDGINGFAIGSIAKSSTTIEYNTEKITYSDGTTISYSDGVLQIDSLKELKIICDKAHIEAQSVIVKSDDISLGDGLSSGVVTGACVCPFTGTMHSDISAKVKAIK